MTDVSRKQIVGAVKECLPLLAKKVKLSELSKSQLTRCAAQGFIDTGIIEVKGDDMQSYRPHNYTPTFVHTLYAHALLY